MLYGRCDEDLGIPYQPWAEVLAHLVGHAPARCARGACRAHEATSWRGSRPISLAAPTTGALTSSDAESERYLLFGAVVDLLARVSALAPVVLVLDDLHWADRPTVQLLRHVVVDRCAASTVRDRDVPRRPTSATDHPLAEALAALHRESGVERLALRGLGDDELLTLLEATARHAMAEDGVALRDALSAETDGNPFFVGEMLRHLAETGAISRTTDGEWVAGADLRTSGLPVSIREVIGRRVARLGAPTRSALSLAAVIGRDFDADVLARVAELDEDTAHRPVRSRRRRGGAHRSRPGRPVHVRARADRAHALRRSVGRPAGALRTGRSRRRSRSSAATIRPSGSESSPTTGLAPRNRRTRARRSRTRNGRVIGPWRSSRPTRRCAGIRDALDLLDRAPDDDPRRRAALLLGLGDAQRQTGDPAHRETLLAAGRLADEVDAVDLLVRAALRNNRRLEQHRRWGRPRARRRCSRARSPGSATPTAPTARACWRCCASSAPGTPISTNACRWRPKPSTSRGAPATTLRWSTRFDSATSRSRCPRPSSSACDGTTEACDLADDLGDPTARLHANDWSVPGGAGGGRPRDDEDRSARSSSRNPSGSDNRSTGGRSPTTGRATDARRRPRRRRAGRDRSPDARHRGRVPGRRVDDSTASNSSTVRWMQGRAARDGPAHRAGRARQPRTPDLPRRSRVREELRRRHDEVRQLLDAEVADDFPMFADATWLVAPRALGRRRRAQRPSTRGDGLVPTPVAVARPVRDDPHHGPRGRGALPRTARPRPRPSRRSRPVVQPSARAPRSDGSAVLRRVDADRVGGTPRRPQDIRGPGTCPIARDRRTRSRDRRRIPLHRARRRAVLTSLE